jgi:4-amino-4-deoxy-L-arabinose transferase-like glycosyltransferase
MDLAFSTMAARSELSPARWRKPFLNWMDGIEAGWAIPLLLAGFVVAWLAFLVIAYIGGDLHSDVLETWTLGRGIEWGYSKHPPLMGWEARAWTSVFPLTNWSFQMLALANSALALWTVDLITRRFAAGDKRLVVLLLLMLMPIYQFHAQRFNANAVLLPIWPIATYCFLRSFETLQIRWAVAAGASAALAMLGKYYSVFLIASFFFAAVSHPQRRAYFTSWTPWVSMVVGFTALLPHLNWLLENGAPPFAYAIARHTGKTFGSALIEAVLFILGVGMILAIPAVTWALIAKQRLEKLPQDFLALNKGLLLLFLIGVGTIVFPAIIAVVLGTDMPPLWAMQGLFLFVILIVCGASYSIERFYIVNLAILVMGIAVFAVTVVAPLHACYRNTHPLHEGRNFYSQAAAELTRRWHEQSDVALALVGGDEGLAFAAAFYSPDHPEFEPRLVLPRSESLPIQTSFRQGWAALCYDGDVYCIGSIERIAARAARSVRFEFAGQSTLWGQSGASQRFTALMVPPYDQERTAPVPTPAIAEDAFESLPVPVRQEEPTCCTHSSDPHSAKLGSEMAVLPAVSSSDGEIKHVRRAAPPSAAAYQVDWPDRAAAATASRDEFARWPIPTPKCSSGSVSAGCRPASHARAPSASRSVGARSAVATRYGYFDQPGRRWAEASLPLSVRLKRKFCAIAADLDAEARLSRERFDAFMTATRERSDRQWQLWRRENLQEQQDRGI